MLDESLLAGNIFAHAFTLRSAGSEWPLNFKRALCLITNFARASTRARTANGLAVSICARRYQHSHPLAYEIKDPHYPPQRRRRLRASHASRRRDHRLEPPSVGISVHRENISSPHHTRWRNRASGGVRRGAIVTGGQLR